MAIHSYETNGRLDQVTTILTFLAQDASHTGSATELVFLTIEQLIKSDPTIPQKINATIVWEITEGDKKNIWSKSHIFANYHNKSPLGCALALAMGNL